MPDSARAQAVIAGGFGACLHVRFVDLDKICAGREQVFDLVVHRVSVSHGQIARLAVVVVLGLLRHGEGTRDRHL